MRKIILRTVPEPGSKSNPEVIGQLVDDGNGPFGTTDTAIDLLGPPPLSSPQDRQARFDQLYQGYSNGYWEAVPA